jgi:hypothetical protein
LDFGGLAMKRLFKIVSRVGIAVAILAGAYLALIRPWHLAWGTVGNEAARTLPGDEFVPNSVHQYTRAITINAPPEKVWPWLVQIGQGRGGLYSYDWLENLVGFDIHSADHIIPELQEIKIGDKVRMTPEGSGQPAFTISKIDPGNALVLTGGDTYSWSFVVEPTGTGATRLLVRARAYADPAWLAPLMYVEPITFFMEQKMLQGIKERAEKISA